MPSAERPLRLAEFEALVGSNLICQDRTDERRLRWLLEAKSEAPIRELADRESECCSFFSFTITADAGGVRVDVEVPGEGTATLDALQARAGLALAAR